MKISLDQFWQAAKAIRMTPGELQKAKIAIFSDVTKRPLIRHNRTMDESVFLRSAKAIRLLPHERVSIKETILGEPLQMSWWTVRFTRLSSVLGSLLVLSMIGGGASYAAESAVPGDILYPLKIHVTEPLMMRMARTEGERARIDALRAERRLFEAERLAARGEMNAERAASLQSSFGAHASAVEARLMTLAKDEKSEQAIELSNEFGAAIKARTEKLQENAAEPTIQPFLERAHTARVVAKEVELEVIVDREESLPPVAADPTPARFNKRAVLEMGLSTEEALIQKTSDTAANTFADDEEEEDSARALSIWSAKSRLTTISDWNDELRIEAEARLNVARKKMRDMESALSPSPVTAPSTPIRSSIEETQALLDRATRAMNAGNIPDATSAATDALEQVQVIRQQVKQLQPALSSSASQRRMERMSSSSSKAMQNGGVTTSRPVGN